MTDRIIAAIILLFLATPISSRLHYITPFKESSRCSSSATDGWSLSCDTFEQVIKSNTTMDRNTTLVLFPGNHSLTFEFVVENAQSFMMQPDRSDQDTVIACNNNSARFLFTNVTEVKIKGLKFIGCGGNMMQFVGNLTITECMFIGTLISGTALVLSNSEAHIKDSQFLSNTIGREYCYNNKHVTATFNYYTEKIHALVGGALFVQRSNVSLTRCTFNGNRAERGAALFIKSKSNLVFNKCSFQNSTGAVIDANDGSCITDHGSSYENNNANLGAVFYALNSNVSFSGSRFINNTANDKGGVLFMYRSNVIFDKCEANGNLAENGGVVYQLLGSLTITNSIITQNVAYNIGVLNSEGHSVLISNSTFSFNRAHLGVIFLSKVTSFEFNNTSIVLNEVSTKGILYAQNVDLKGSGRILIENNTANLSIVYVIQCNVTLSDGSTFSFSKNSASFTAINSFITLSGSSSFFGNGWLPKVSVDFKEGGAITTVQSTVLIRGKAKIDHNYSASSGGGIYAIESAVKMYGTDNTYVNITCNKAKFSGGGIYLYSSILICRYECEISSNEVWIEEGSGGGIHAIGSSILVSKPSKYELTCNDFDKKSGFIRICYRRLLAILTITNNYAYHGGGCMFEASSKLAPYIRNHDSQCHVNFTGNKAVLGGAIFINDSTTAGICDSNSLSSTSVKTECFLQKFYFIDEGYNKTNTVIPMTSIIYFTNNFANESGSILFGGLLDRCTISPFSYEMYTKEGEPISYISGLGIL